MKKQPLTYREPVAYCEKAAKDPEFKCDKLRKKIHCHARTLCVYQVGADLHTPSQVIQRLRKRMKAEGLYEDI